MSAFEANGTLAMCSPVTGERSSYTSSPVPSVNSPSMKSFRSRVMNGSISPRMPTWDPDQYLVFDDARTRPAAELLARIQSPAPGTVVDVGCGPGNSTARLVERWPEAAITGIDTSAEMLDRARSAVPQAEFVEADLRTWAPPSAVDVVFSNATLQWVEDHPAVFRHLLSWLAPGGVLAVQMPSNFSEPSHTELRAVAASKPWRDHLRGVLRENPVAAPEFYYRLLKAPGR